MLMEGWTEHFLVKGGQVKMHKSCALLDQVVDFKDNFLAQVLLKVLREQELSLTSDLWRVKQIVKKWFQACPLSNRLRNELNYSIAEVSFVVVAD